MTTIVSRSHDPDQTSSFTPSARRASPPSWRDPRLVVGVTVIALSVLLGAKLLGAADDSVAVWAVRTDLRSGTTVDVHDLVERRVRFAEAAAADRYVAAASSVPAGTTLLRDIGAGELLPRASLGAAGARSLTEVPVSVSADAVPVTVRTGAVVDVWVTPESPGAVPSSESILVFNDVVVLAAPRSGTALGPSSTRQLIIGVDATQEEQLPSALAKAASGTIVVTKKG